jgi:putative hydrolase of the HAD superfamily
MIQAIVYDAVGTLLHVQPSVAAVYADIGRRFGSQLGDAEVGRRFRDAFSRQERLDREAGWRTSEARERERWQAIVADVLSDADDSAGCFASLYDHFASPAAWRCDPDAAVVLAALRKQGFRQALASNFDRRLRGVIADMAPFASIDEIVISSEVGWRKPAAEFFAALMDRLHLSADAILFIGDDRHNDYEAARRAGMPARLLDPLGRHHDVGADRLEGLTGLLDVVKG